MVEEIFQMIHVSMNFILYQMIGLHIMDDDIIYSWCFKFVECFDSIRCNHCFGRKLGELVEPQIPAGWRGRGGVYKNGSKTHIFAVPSA